MLGERIEAGYESRSEEEVGEGCQPPRVWKECCKCPQDAPTSGLLNVVLLLTPVRLPAPSFLRVGDRFPLSSSRADWTASKHKI